MWDQGGLGRNRDGQDEQAGQDRRGHGLHLHADNLHFVVSEKDEEIPGARYLPAGDLSHGNWDLMKQGALATGAFPLELARQELAGDRCDRNPREPGKAKRAVILIDPFPNPADTDPAPIEESDLLTVFTRMFGALKEQARFKPEELLLAGQETVFSRFMISPSRIGAEGEEVAFPLACSSVGAFGGFLAREFRHHDFHLGRRNAQRFLSRWFAIPEEAENPLFAEWTDGMKAEYGIDRDGIRYLPIIPLKASSREPVELPPWPRRRNSLGTNLAP